MFTGIVVDLAQLIEIRNIAQGKSFIFKPQKLHLSAFAPGASIAINGCCLTITKINIEQNSFEVDLSLETLDKTIFATIQLHEFVNIEPSLTANATLDGHFVSGHVDGVGKILSLDKNGASTLLKVQVPPTLMPYMAVKGSVTIDGVSLTINDIDDASIFVNLIPHTQSLTRFQFNKKSDDVNIEIDLIARYVARLLKSKGIL